MIHKSTKNLSRGLYRSRQGMIFGVCRGLANYAELSPAGVRVAFLIGLFLTGVWPAILVYIMLAIFLKPEPVVEFDNEEDREFYDSYAADRRLALSRLKRRFENLDRRARRLENIVTNKEYQWDRRLRSSS